MSDEKAIGYLQTEEKGKIVNSSVRYGYFIMLFVVILYLFFSVYNYYRIIYMALEMAKSNPAFEASMLSLVQTLNIVDLGLFALLLLAWISPKSIAKYLENKIK